MVMLNTSFGSLQSRFLRSTNAEPVTNKALINHIILVKCNTFSALLMEMDFYHRPNQTMKTCIMGQQQRYQHVHSLKSQYLVRVLNVIVKMNTGNQLKLQYKIIHSPLSFYLIFTTSCSLCLMFTQCHTF